MKALLGIILFSGVISTGCIGRSVSVDPAGDLVLVKQRVFDLYSGRGTGSGVTGPYRRAAGEKLAHIVDGLLKPGTRDGWPHDIRESNYGRRVNNVYYDLLGMAQAYHYEGQPHYHSPDLKAVLRAGMLDALAFTREGTPRPGNWYPWFIGIAKAYCPLLVLTEGMYDRPFHEEQLAALRSLLKNGPHLSGQNGIWEGNNAFILAALTGDVAGARRAMGFISRESSLSHGGGGVLEDYSFQFHGRVLYTGSYGAGFIFRMALTMRLTEGTVFELPVEKRELIGRFFNEHALRPLMRGCPDLAVLGRSTGYGGRPNRDMLNGYLLMTAQRTSEQSGIRRQVAGLLSELTEPLPVMAASFADGIAATDATPVTGFKYFNMSDYATFRCPGFYVSVKMLSDHVMDYEGNWGANMSGWNLSNGAIYLSRTGGELWPDGTIHAGWDWEHLPGTTNRLGAHPAKSYNYGTSGLVGGAGSETAGITGFKLIPVAGNFEANKSYFMFENGFVALGSGIRSGKKGARVQTTAGQWVLPVGTKPLKTDSFVWADSVAYIRQGPEKMATRGKEGILTVWYDHGTHPRDGRYAYAVLPQCDVKTAAAYAEKPSVEIVSHTEELHAYRNTANGDLGMLFFTPGAFRGITVDQPAAVFVENGSAGKVVTVSCLEHDARPLTAGITTGVPASAVPDGANTSYKNGIAAVVLQCVSGRQYRIGLGAAEVKQVRHEQGEYLKGFGAVFEQGDSVSYLTVSVPEHVKTAPYGLHLHRSKGQYQGMLTGDDKVAELPDGRVKYRWVSADRKKERYYVKLVAGIYGGQAWFTLK